MFTVTLKAILEIVGLLGFGMVARKLSYIKDEDVTNWSRFILDLLYPALAFASILRDLDASRLTELWLLPLCGFGIMALGFFAGMVILPLIAGSSADRRKTFHHLCIMNNYTYLPIIIIGAIWGKAFLPDLFLLSLGSSVGVWTMGIGVLGRARLRDNLRNLLNPNIVAILLGVALCLTGLRNHIPAVIVSIFGAAGNAAVPCAIILTGSSLLTIRFSGEKRLLILSSAMRLFVLPALTIVILKLLPLPYQVYQVSVVVALMPAAVASPLFVRRFGGDAALAAQTLVVTTAISCITVPLAMMLLF